MYRLLGMKGPRKEQKPRPPLFPDSQYSVSGVEPENEPEPTPPASGVKR